MSTATTASPIQREPELRGQTVVVIGGSAGIRLETARWAGAEGPLSVQEFVRKNAAVFTASAKEA